MQLTSVIGKVFSCVWLHPGSLAEVLHAQEHHFSPDELSGVITVPHRPVTQIKAVLPRFVSTESCLCSSDPALMRNSTLLLRHIILFPLYLASFTFTQYYYGLISPTLDQGCAVFLYLFCDGERILFNISQISIQLLSTCEWKYD